MTQQRHADLSVGNIHKINQWSVADTTVRDALSVTARDIGKVCKVGSDLYWLSSVSPNVWSNMGGGGGLTNLDGGAAATVYETASNLDGGGT